MNYFILNIILIKLCKQKNIISPQALISLRTALVVVMKYHHDGSIINYMGRIKFRISNKHWRKYKQITIDHKRILLRFSGNYKRPIRMKRNIDIRRVEICGIHLETLILSLSRFDKATLDPK